MTKASSAASAVVNTAGRNLRVETGETALLSPDSARFGSSYKQIYPRGIDEVRQYLGVSDAAAAALKAYGCGGCRVPAVLAAPEDLTSDDAATRRRAKGIAVQAARLYVTNADPSRLTQWKPFIDRYLEIGKVIINLITLEDIDVANGGTLVVSGSTNALYANNIRIHGTGRIVCQGDITIKCQTLQGVLPLVVNPAAVARVDL